MHFLCGRRIGEGECGGGGGEKCGKDLGSVPVGKHPFSTCILSKNKLGKENKLNGSTFWLPGEGEKSKAPKGCCKCGGWIWGIHWHRGLGPLKSTFNMRYNVFYGPHHLRLAATEPISQRRKLTVSFHPAQVYREIKPYPCSVVLKPRTTTIALAPLTNAGGGGGTLSRLTAVLQTQT